MATPPALRLSAVHKRFGNVDVLRGVTLEVQPDEVVALVGETGTGKTTIARCVAAVMTPDSGTVEVQGQPAHSATPGTVEVVWQDLALCDNLDVAANLFLGREQAWRLTNGADLQVRAARLLAQLGVHIPDPGRPVSTLSGGQRQSVALARTLVGDPDLLVLDEPTTGLDSTKVGAVEELIRLKRSRGAAILLISHDMDLVCRVADRALVLRDGQVSGDIHRPSLTPDELRTRMAGLQGDALAQRQLHGLRSLVDQLSAVKPTAVLPMIVSAVSVALEQERLALHLWEPRSGGGPRLRLAAALGLSRPLRSALEALDVDDGDPHVQAVTSRSPVDVPDLRGTTGATAIRDHGVRSMWTVPLIGGGEVLGTLSGYGETRGATSPGALELASLYAVHAATALERERLLTTVTRRNRTLETLRQMLETLAGPDGDERGLCIALEALRHGLGAEQIVLVDVDGDTSTVRVSSPATDSMWATAVDLPEAGQGRTLETGDGGGPILAASVAERGLRRGLLARWEAGEHPRTGALDLLVDGAHSMLLALERQEFETARQEATALRRSNGLQRTFLARLSHELRTPLTAIHGYADSLRQSDISWDDSTTLRFLDTIVRESDRMGALVTDLLDASAIEAGVLHLQPDWCDLGLVVDAAVACVSATPPSVLHLEIPAGLPPLRADHDRLEQVLVNLVGNALRHTPPGTRTSISAALAPDGQMEVVVADDGPGLPPAVAAALFVPGVRGQDSGTGAGLGLSISRGIVHAHGGTIDVTTSAAGTRFSIRLPVEGAGADLAGWELAADADAEVSA